MDYDARHDALLAATRHHLREHPEHAAVPERWRLCQALEALGFGHVTEGEAAVYIDAVRSGVVVYVPSDPDLGSGDGTEGNRITVYPAREAA